MFAQILLKQPPKPPQKAPETCPNTPQKNRLNTLKNRGVLNYGIGNYLSVKNMINHIGHDCSVIENKLDITKFDKIIISPGPGLPSDYPILFDVLKHYFNRKDILGICLGCQAIASFFGLELLKK